MPTPTFEECLADAYTEYVRGWLAEHPFPDTTPHE